MARPLGGPRASDTESGVGPTQVSDASKIGAQGQVTETIDQLQLERLDWLKLNFTVPALDVLDGAVETLWRLRPLLFIAAPDEISMTALAARGREFSYRCWQMETPLFNPKNFNRRDTDIFSGRATWALLAIPEEIDVDVALEGCVELP